MSAPDVPQEIYDMQNEILGTCSETDFSSDDLGNDPSYVPKTKSSLRNYYETACNVLISSPEISGSVLRELPSDISSSSYSEYSLSRKRKRNTELWKQNIRKNLHDRGLPFVNSKGVERPGRALGPVCSQSCFYTCTTKVSEDERQDIHSHFWSLSSSEKQIFYGNFVKKVMVKRRRSNCKEQDQPKKKSSFHFYFKSNNKTVQVCKKYFLNTLSISERVIYYFFAKHYEVDTVEAKSKLKDCGKKPTEEHRIIEVKTHISSFPTVDSHYCRSTTSRKYLEAHLSVQKMFDLYKISTNNPVSINIYRKVFNTGFNLSFYAPRKDICDKCHIFKVNAGKQSEAEIQLHQKHLEENRFTKAERDADLQNIDNNSAVLIYDLENVFTLPKMFASSFYYKRKLSVYNLTGTLIIPNQEKVTYCALWNETLSGRSGNDIASALIKILSKVATDHPSLNTITLWSDSCVPQNRNRVTATALLQFIHDNPKMEEIKQKFSEPGHSSLQQVDCVHSAIEKYLRNLEIPSQVSLIRLLKNIKFPNIKLSILQMTEQDFKCYSIKSDSLNFKDIQFFKCKSLMYSKSDLFKVGAKLSLKYATYSILDLRKHKSRYSNIFNMWKQEFRLVPKKQLDLNKKKDLKSCIPFLEKEEDKCFYRAILKM